ncbi:hypothetical protein NDU88_003317 [Pleurodeles waltl]|uniref:Uncharacterized protein n=1 Tax=Pleurodeles waltl TaxID=8319 RepID=A0AAV7M468_PLEWA|nr:hypothetical protein NDU88_003317 [Pleurodeles waltl]
MIPTQSDRKILPKVHLSPVAQRLRPPESARQRSPARARRTEPCKTDRLDEVAWERRVNIVVITGKNWDQVVVITVAARCPDHDWMWRTEERKESPSP